MFRDLRLCFVALVTGSAFGRFRSLSEPRKKPGMICTAPALVPRAYIARGRPAICMDHNSRGFRVRGLGPSLRV